VTKPFGVRELRARLDALLRRAVHEPPSTFQAGALEVRVEHAEARAGDERYPLTEREIRILRALAEEPGRIVGRSALLRDAWGMNNVDQLETRTVDVHIAKLRKKLGRHSEMIVTVRGHGYRLCP
jgi:two-component system response regulator RegX3